MLDVSAWSFACPHSVSLFHPVSALKEDVSCGLPSLVTLALIGIALVDGMEIRAQNLACAHLRDARADRTVCADVCGKR